MPTIKKRRVVAPVTSMIMSPAEQKLASVFAQRHSEALGFLFCMIGTLGSAREALNQSFSMCLGNVQLAEIANYNALIFRVMYNVAVETTKGGRPKRRKSASETDVVASTLDPTWVFMNEEQRAFSVSTCRAIFDLPFDERAIFLLRHNGALNYQQIAQITNLSLGDVKTKMKSAIMAVYSAFEETVASASAEVESTPAASPTSSTEVEP